jgi:hypothetical protein
MEEKRSKTDKKMDGLHFPIGPCLYVLTLSEFRLTGVSALACDYRADQSPCISFAERTISWSGLCVLTFTLWI